MNEFDDLIDELDDDLKNDFEENEIVDETKLDEMIEELLNDELDEELNQNDLFNNQEILEETNLLDETINELLDSEELDEDSIDKIGILRDVLDQNVKTQHLPSIDKFNLLDEDNPRNTTYQVKDDANIRLYDKFIKETIELTGEEYNDYLLNEYGTNKVEYHCGEPDFSDYVQQINSEDISSYLDKEIESSFNGKGKLEKSIMSIERLGENGTLTEAYQQIADELGCTSEEVKNYIDYENLVIHEAGKNEFILIPSDVHNVFRHTGSIGVKKDLNTFKSEVNPNNHKLFLDREWKNLAIKR